MEVMALRGDPMKDNKIPSHQIDVVEIMKKIRQSASSSRTELTIEEKVRREAKSELISLAQAAQIPDSTVDEIRQQTVFEPYDPRTLYSSSRPGVGSLIGFIRKLLKPITKLFINLDPMAHEVNRLCMLNNFYLKAVQDLIVKNSALRVEMHQIKRRTGHQHGRDHSRSNNQNFRRRHPRREHSGEMRNRHPRPGSRTPVAEEPQA
jgi:hypothetical protein